MEVPLLILNYNGRALLQECLPSVLRAAEASRHDCRVLVVDNASTDDSRAWLCRAFPQVGVVRCSNRGLCSYNDVLAGVEAPVAVLLNNDIKLAPDCLDPLLAPLQRGTPQYEAGCFLTAPCCWLFDGRTYEGLKTAARWRWGLVQATALFEGHEGGIRRPGRTASAGAVMAVDREKFLFLGGFDPLYLPGRLEDLDFAFRGYQAGYHALYVPEAVAYHRGQATFARELTPEGCDRLALRNTLLFQWKNLRHPRHLALQAAGYAARLARDVAVAPWASGPQRFAFARALLAALARRRDVAASRVARPRGAAQRERAFFAQFSPRRMRADAAGSMPA